MKQEDEPTRLHVSSVMPIQADAGRRNIDFPKDDGDWPDPEVTGNEA